MEVAITGTDQLVRRLLEMGQDAPKAGARAVNRVRTTLVRAILRAVSGETGLPQKAIEALRQRGAPMISSRKANYRNLNASVFVTGKRLRLIQLRARQTAKGVSYRLPGAKTVPGAFIATMRSGHTGVFERKGKARLPIRELFGPSLPHLVEKRIADLSALGQAELAKNLAHEIAFLIGQRTPAGDE